MSEKVKDSVQRAWREKHYHDIMNNAKRVLEEVRDDPESNDTDRVNASKALVRMVAGFQVDKTPISTTKKENPILKKVLSEKDLKEIKELANGDW